MSGYIYSLMTDQAKGFTACILKAVLLIFSYIFAAGQWAVRSLYLGGALKRYKAGCKVISVGNMTLGGTGKTPIVESIAKDLVQRNKKIAVLIRGYGDDEHKLLGENLKGAKIYVGRDRIKNARIAVEKDKADIILLDDGFQHWRLRRDIDIVLINARDPFGNAKLIPRGILREPLSALKRADIFIVTKAQGDVSGIISKLKSINPKARVFTSRYKAGGPGINGKKICALSAIADPGYFEDMLKAQGAQVVLSRKFRDHHAYTLGELRDIAEKSREKGAQAIVTTQKDMVKIKASGFKPEIPVIVLEITPEIDSKEEFFAGLYSRVNN